MGIQKPFSACFFAKYIIYKNNRWKNQALKAQKKTLFKIIDQAKNTDFGRAHAFSKIQSYNEFKNNVPIKDYEGFKPYIEKIIGGKLMFCGLKRFILQNLGYNFWIKIYSY